MQTNCKRKSLTTIDDRCYFCHYNQTKHYVMSKTIKLVLLLCFILSGAISHAHGAARTEKENEEGVPISIILKTQHGGTDKSGSIVSVCWKVFCINNNPNPSNYYYYHQLYVEYGQLVTNHEWPIVD